MGDIALSVVIPTIQQRSEVLAIEYLDHCEFDDYEVILRDDVPVTKARNAGYQRANSDRILFLDDDSMPRNGYLREAAATLSEEDAVAGRTVHPRDDMFAGQLTSHYSFGDESKYVDRFWGCNMGLQRSTLDAVGGWDERMGWGHEEKDLATRVVQEHDIYYNPDMVVDHPYAESLLDFWHKQYRLEMETPYYLSKHGFSKRQILTQTVTEFLQPSKYLGRTASLSLARSGRTIAKTAGRLSGLRDDRLRVDDDTRHSV